MLKTLTYTVYFRLDIYCIFQTIFKKYDKPGKSADHGSLSQMKVFFNHWGAVLPVM